ncbi:MAG: hypothetical protein JXR78_10090 [Victivallales bacterium]|nr:hypothetical protein [Victivallales bacterium]
MENGKMENGKMENGKMENGKMENGKMENGKMENLRSPFKSRKLLISMTIISIMFIVFTGMAQEKNRNLFRNSELIEKDGKIADWGFQGSYSSCKGYKGKNSVCIKMDRKGRTLYQSTMGQNIRNLSHGKYIFSAYVKLDKKIDALVLCRIITQNGKSVYQSIRLDSTQQEIEKWTKMMLEFDIPEGINSAFVAFDLRDKSAGAKVWIDSPLLEYKAE